MGQNMLKSLTIKNFKSIKHAELSFGRANIFIGANGAGKSNILEALGILSSALSRGLDSPIIADRGVRLSLPHLFKSSFKNTSLSPHFRLEAQFENGHYECSIRSGLNRNFLEFHSEALYDGQVKVFGRSPNGIKINKNMIDLDVGDFRGTGASRSLWDIISPFCTISDKLRQELDEFSRFVIYAPQTAVMRGLAIETRVIKPLGLAGSGLAAAFQDVLTRRRGMKENERKKYEGLLSLISKPGWVQGVRVRGYDPKIVPPEVSSEGLLLYFKDRYMTEKRNDLSPYDASEGTLYLTFVATLLLHKQAPKAFGLDNVDGTLNPDLVRELTDTVVSVCSSGNPFSEEKQQAFLTSHHPSSIDSFDIFNSSHRIFSVTRDERSNGRTKFTPILPPEGFSKSAWIKQKRGKNLSQLWLEGKIPGALNNG